MFIKILLRVFSIFLMIMLGAIARRRGILDSEATRRLALSVTNFFYPAMIFSSLVRNFDLASLLRNWTLPAGTIMIMLLGYLVGLAALRVLDFEKPAEGHAFHFQCTINNYSFLPLPIILLFWGNAGVAGLLFSSLGSEISVWTFGVLALTGNRLRRDSLRNLLSLPMLSIAAAILTIVVRDFPAAGSLPAEAAAALMNVLDLFGKATVPLAMFQVGSRISELTPRHLFTLNQFYVVLLRLTLIPALALILLFSLPLDPLPRLVLGMVAIMPGAIASVVLSDVYGADREFAASSVMATHLFSLLTIPAWMTLLLASAGR
ncbi:MAG: Membrane transport protein [candidate division TA06 bacterium ADurb.Bin417]|uniref:Membrane transport protein n=1 Tax=candidate division TA06 bacterium ADurb.Bin417 TaxID=1852828 RepID=A0A1V5MJ27_UNCT6|nr:MAG: Membrane transport protein [candidate division TA06 bacterium ADurb.Bin417]